VALERLAYLLVTTAIVGVAAAMAIVTLPLSRHWVHIFEGVAIAAAVAIVVPIVLLARRREAEGLGDVEASVASTSAASKPRSAQKPRSALARFVRELDVQGRALVYGDRRRLIALLLLEAAAYVAMALEVWVALWASGTPITLIGAMAIETFTRVASMVSAFIPANLGALEVSNVAAASAMHAAGGAAALALVRRFRGLIWCAAGFLVYPRTDRHTSRVNRASWSSESQMISEKPERESSVLVVLDQPRDGNGADDEVTIADRLGGMTIGERILSAAARAGYSRVLVWSPRQQNAWEALATRARPKLDVIVASEGNTHWSRDIARLDAERAVTVLASGTVASPPLLEDARAIDPHADSAPWIEVPAGADWPHSGVFRTWPSQLVSPEAAAASIADVEEWAHVRHEPSGSDVAMGRARLSIRTTTREALARGEQRLRASIFKPTDGVCARLNRRVSIPISVALIRAIGFSAHAMSLLIIALGLYAGWLFSLGTYGTGVAAALVSWAASVLDGCDGELARLQYRESDFGTWLDTLGDYTYYLAVFTGLTIGVARQTGWVAAWWMGAALLVGALLTFAFLILLRQRITRGRPERLNVTTRAHFYATGKRWAWLVAKISTVATRATMPYGIVVLAVLNLLPVLLALAVIGAQIYWISLAVEFRRLVDRSHAIIPKPADSKSVEPVF
jgi:phosphatidylglycerophosphate synthase